VYSRSVFVLAFGWMKQSRRPWASARKTAARVADDMNVLTLHKLKLSMPSSEVFALGEPHDHSTIDQTAKLAVTIISPTRWRRAFGACSRPCGGSSHALMASDSFHHHSRRHGKARQQPPPKPKYPQNQPQSTAAQPTCSSMKSNRCLPTGTASSAQFTIYTSDRGISRRESSAQACSSAVCRRLQNGDVGMPRRRDVGWCSDVMIKPPAARTHFHQQPSFVLRSLQIFCRTGQKI
jgi:hypothetical protein